MKNNWLAFVLMIILVPLAGELKFYPFSNELSNFRVSFGSPAFLFFILWVQKLPLLLTGLLCGLSVLSFRMILDVSTGAAMAQQSFMLHVPAFFYYVTYGAIFYLANVKNVKNQPWTVAALSILAEISASMLELFLTSTTNPSEVFHFPVIGEIMVAAVIRSFFVLSFFYIIQLRQTELVAEQQKEQNKHMLLIISSLYEEMVQLAKSQKYAENITRDCYNLSKSLQANDQSLDKSELSKSILTIAGQIHEIKKDNHRIYASLTRLISNGKINDYMPAGELVEVAVQSHQKYARSLGKHIEFEMDVADRIPPLHVHTILSIVNNLISNAVESIKDAGQIATVFTLNHECLEIRVADNGPGVPPKKRETIFRPGYTTKFDASGNPSTGMGLPYVKDLTESLNGTVSLQNSTESDETIFVIKLPLNSVTKE
ncbi:Sensor histidine kinase GlnK [Sporomusa rhizae]|uniref:ATP-binding protein n=1 Tax=Sporomusa rhizae TaxID=357999 RepID=UPI00352AE07C